MPRAISSANNLEISRLGSFFNLSAFARASKHAHLQLKARFSHLAKHSEQPDRAPCTTSRVLRPWHRILHHPVHMWPRHMRLKQASASDALSSRQKKRKKKPRAWAHARTSSSHLHRRSRLNTVRHHKSTLDNECNSCCKEHKLVGFM